MNLSQLSAPFLVAFLLSATSTALVISLAKKWGLLDDPKKRFHPAHTHTGSIPRAGGISLFLGIVVASVLFLPISPIFISILLGITILLVVGIIDDYRDVHPYIRLVTNGCAVLLVLVAGVHIPYITNPLSGGVIHLAPLFSFILSFAWIYWTMNIIGWSAGVDGQLPGVVVVSSLILGFLSLRYSSPDATQLPVTILSCIVAGSFLGFLPWNFYPQKIMPGYSGKTIAGFLLAILGILSFAKLGTALLVLGVPMIDASYTLLRRLMNRKSPVRADRGHLHHHLLDLGWKKPTIALCYYLFSAILGAIALSVSSRQKLIFLGVLAVLIGGFLLWVHWVWQYSKRRDPDNG